MEEARSGNTSLARLPITKPESNESPIFLSIPGEIRNNIYKFCAEDRANKMSPVFPYNQFREMHPICLRNFNSLTQVCRQLRHEFHPVYLKHNEVILKLRDITFYMSTFYPLEKSNGEPFTDEVFNTYHGKIKLSVGQDQSADILPIIEACTKMPNVILTATRYRFCHPETFSEIKSLFNKDSSLGKYQLSHGSPLAEVWVDYHFATSHLRFYFKKQFERPTFVSFLEQAGLMDLKHFTVKLETQTGMGT